MIQLSTDVAKAIASFVVAWVMSTVLNVALAGELYGFRVLGFVETVEPELSSAFRPGDTISATFVYDAGTPDQDSRPDVGQYSGAIVYAEGKIGSAFQAFTDVSQGIFVNNDNPYDDVTWSPYYDPGNFTVNGYRLRFFGLQLRDRSGIALTDDSIPISIALSQYDQRFFSASFRGSDFDPLTYVVRGYPYAITQLDPDIDGDGELNEAEIAAIGEVAPMPAEVLRGLQELTENLLGIAGTALLESISAKLEATAGNYLAALNKLDAYINQIEAQRGKKLTNAQADQLISIALSVRNSLGTQ